MNRAPRSVLLALFGAIAAWSLACTDGGVPPARTQSSAASSVSFRSTARLAEHFQKHGPEFGSISQTQYLQLAQQLRDSPVGDDIVEVVRQSDGVISRFDRRSGAFLAADADGTIRTFFKPNDGEAYFRRQARRSPRS